MTLDHVESLHHHLAVFPVYKYNLASFSFDRAVALGRTDDDLYGVVFPYIHASHKTSSIKALPEPKKRFSYNPFL